MNWKNQVEIEVVEGWNEIRTVYHGVTITLPSGESFDLDLKEEMFLEDYWNQDSEYDFVGDTASKIAEELGIDYQELLDYCVELLEA